MSQSSQKLRLEQEIEKLEVEKASLQSQIQTLQQSVTAHQTQLNQSKQNVAQEEVRLRKQALDNLASITEEIRKKEGFYKSIEQNHQKKLEKLRLDKEAESQRMEMIENRTAELFNEQSEHKRHIDTAVAEIAKLKETVSLLNDTKDRLLADKDEIEATIKQLDIQKIETLNDYARANVLKESIQAEVEKIEAKYHEKLELLQQVNSEVQKSANDVVLAQHNVESIQQDIAKRALEIDRREEALLLREQKVQSLEKRVAEYNRFIKLT